MRVCQHYGSQPVFLAASATIANPGELTSRLLGRDVQVIDQDGSPRGRKYFVLWNPSPLGHDRLARRSAADDAVWLMVQADAGGGQTLTFTRTRQAAELVHRYAQDALRQQRSPLADKLRAYRGGYLPNERRQIEQALFSGQLRGVAATNALGIGSRHRLARRGAAGALSRARSPAPGSRRAAAAGGRTRAWPCCWPATTRWISICCGTRSTSFPQSPEHAVVDPRKPVRLGQAPEGGRLRIAVGRAAAGAFWPTRRPRWRRCFARREELGAGRRQDLLQRRAESRSADQSAAHERQHVQHRALWLAGTNRRKSARRSTIRRRRSPACLQLGTPRHEMSCEHQVIANVDAISAPELIYPEAVYLHNGETYFIRETRSEGQGGLRRTPRDGLLHAGRAGEQRAD